MPREDGYAPRVMPSAGAQQPLPTADNYGAGIGRAMAELGDDAHRRDLRAYQIDRQQRADQEWTDFVHRSAVHQQRMDDLVREKRTSPSQPDYGEHVQQVLEADEAARPDLYSGITDESVMHRAQQWSDSYRARLQSQEGDFVQAERVGKSITDAGSFMNIEANRLRRSGNAKDWSVALGRLRDYVNGLSLLTPRQKEDMLQRGKEAYTASFVNGLVDKSPATALKLLGDGAFDEYLDPRQIDQLRNGSQVEIRRADAEAAHQANITAAATREEIQTAVEKTSQGIDVSADLPRLAAAAQALGDTSTVAKLQGLARDSAFAKVWGAVSPLARQQELQRLQAIPEGKRSEEQQAAVKWLVDKGPALDSKFNEDPVGFAARTAPAGMGPPPIADFSPAELAQREKWMRQANGAYGHMDLLSDAEVRDLQERAGTSDRGYRDVLAALGTGLSSRVAMQAVRQVLPKDDFAQAVVALSRNVQRQALDGREVRKTNPAILRTPKDDVPAWQQLEGVKAGFHLALGNVPAVGRNGILDVAEAIAADALAKNGQLSEHMSGAMLARSLDAALGSTGAGPTKKGGIGWWGGAMYLLPAQVSQAGFEGHVSRYVRDHPDQAPVNPDGSPADLRRARPLALGGDRYQFMVGDRVVMGKDGKPWIRTVRAK